MKIRKQVAAVLAAFLLLAGTLTVFVPSARAQQFQSRMNGEFYPAAYTAWRASMVTGNTATGSQTVTVSPAFVTLPDGRQFSPWSVLVPITIDIASSSSSETVTPTAVSCNQSGGLQMGGTCNITASFTYTHGTAINSIMSGTFGLADAQLDAFNAGGGQVLVDNTFGGTNSTITALVALQSVGIDDKRSAAPQYWRIQPGLTVVSAPSTLTASTVGPCPLTGACATAVAGSASWGGTTYACVAYVDAMGNEGPCSATFNFTSTASTAVGFTAPAASAGMVGWIPYLSLSGGSYAKAYRIQPTSAICTLTKVETTIAACALTNATYGQTGSAAVITGYPVNTSRIWVGTGGTSSTSNYVGNSNARTSYAYAPSNGVGIPGVVSVSQPFTTATATATTVPGVIGTVQLPAGFMNYVGRSIEICGTASEASAGSTATIEHIQFFWDADGSNSTGAGVKIGDLETTGTLVTSNADQIQFCETFTTTVSGAGATAGSINQSAGQMSATYGAGVIGVDGGDVLQAAVASLNLAGEARIDVVWQHTTGTDGAGVLLNGLTIKSIN